MKIKLFDLAREIEIGVQTLYDCLSNKKVIDTPYNPNIRIDDKAFKVIIGEFGSGWSAERKKELEDKFFSLHTTKTLPEKPKSEPVTSSNSVSKSAHSKEQKKPATLEVKGHIDLDAPKKVLKEKGGITKKTVQAPTSSKVTEEKKPEVDSAFPKGSSTEEQKSIFKKDNPASELEKTQEKPKVSPQVSVKNSDETEKTQEKPKVSPQVSVKNSNETEKTQEKPKVSPLVSVKNSDETEKTQEKPKVSPLVSVKNSDVLQKTPSETEENIENPQKKNSETKENKDFQKKRSEENPVGHNDTPKGKTTDQQRKSLETNKEASTNKEPVTPFRFNNEKDMPKIQIMGKIDLDAAGSSASKGKKKTERTKRKRFSAGAVDIKAEAAKGINNTPGKSGRNGNKPTGETDQGRSRQQQQHSPQDSQQPKGRKARRNAQKKEIAKQEISSEDIEKKVKEVRARIATGKRQSFGKGDYRRKRDTAKKQAEQEALLDEQEKKVIKITEFVTVSDLANLMEVPVNEVIATCMSIDIMVSINMRLDSDTIALIAEEFGFKTEFVSADVVEAIAETRDEDNEEDLEERPPVVTVMGHVDHGKTSLLDHIRNTNVIAGEAGGITQHIGAYSVKLKSGRKVTFLDTPGHQAFTAMRARGAKATDIVIIIIDSTSDVMPQTKEALNHAAAAGVPIVFALNKVDKPTANPNHIKEQLAQLNYLVEDWGGKYQCQEISAKKGDGVRELLDKVLLEADLLELKANPNRIASGLVIESSLDKGRGYVAQILVSNGTLRVGDMVLAGKYCGRVRALTNERGQNMNSASPSTPATLLGLDGAPSAGDTFNVLENEQEARNIARRRRQLDREQDIRTRHRLTLEQIGERIKIGNFKELNLIIKGDVDGSIEALSDSLIKLSTPEIDVKVIHKAVGQISENDVDLAKASDAIIIGFQVRPNNTARRLAEQYGVEIRTYSIIYDAIDDVKSAMEGMLSPEIREQISANLEVLQVFNIKGTGTIAGCMVKEGKIKRSDKVRVIREGIVIHTGSLASLKRFKDDAKEVVAGLECGLSIENYDGIQAGDLLESFAEFEVKKKL